MEVFVIIFIIAAEILGEIAEYYVNVRGGGTRRCTLRPAFWLPLWGLR